MSHAGRTLVLMASARKRTRGKTKNPDGNWSAAGLPKSTIRLALDVSDPRQRRSGREAVQCGVPGPSPTHRRRPRRHPRHRPDHRTGLHCRVGQAVGTGIARVHARPAHRRGRAGGCRRPSGCAGASGGHPVHGDVAALPVRPSPQEVLVGAHSLLSGVRAGRWPRCRVRGPRRLSRLRACRSARGRQPTPPTPHHPVWAREHGHQPPLVLRPEPGRSRPQPPMSHPRVTTRERRRRRTRMPHPELGARDYGTALRRGPA